MSKLPNPRYKIAMPHGPEGGSGWKQLAPAGEEGYATLKRLGFNTLVLSWRLRGQTAWWEAKDAMQPFVDNVALGKKHGFTIWTWLHTGFNTRDHLDVGQTNTVTAEGKTGHVSCPIDENFWQKYLTPIGVAEAKTPGVDGVLLETEVYGEGRYDREENCFCERCVRRFQESRKAPNIVVPPPAERKSWFEKQNLLGAFSDWQEGELRARARDFRSALQAVNPKLRLGYYVGPGVAENWYYRGLSQGLYDGAQPLLNMDQGTYYGVGIHWMRGGKMFPLPDWERHMQGVFASWNVPVEITHGIYLDTAVANFTAKEVERFCFISGISSSGHWTWNEWRDATDLYQAYRSANFKIDWALRSPQEFIERMGAWIAVRKQEHFDTTFAEGLMQKANDALKAGDVQNAIILAYQAEWSLRK